MKKLFCRPVLLAFLLAAGALQEAGAQTPAPDGNPWYIGVQGGTSFGQGTFRSITEHQTHWGLQGGLFGGYRLNRFLSLEAGLQLGGQDQFALDCCPYWMSSNEVRYMAPVLDQDGWYYRDLKTATQWGKLSLQANANLLGFLPQSRWALTLSPQLSAVTTKTTLVAPDRVIPHDRQWHLGLGAQAGVGYQISEKIGAALYGGITCLTGARFDNIAVHAHKSNLLWEAGIKFSYSFGGKKKAAPAPVLASVPVVEPAPAVVPEVPQEPVVTVTEPEPEVVDHSQEEAAAKEAAKEAAFQTPIPTVYFLHDSHRMDPATASSLEEALSILQKYPDFQLEIHAYSSRIGNKAYNLRLSQKRMEEVRQWFREHGIGDERMGQSYYHGVDYKAPTAAQARRAELKFVK